MVTEALWYLGDRKVEMRSIEVPDPGRSDVLVRMEACGVCRGDIVGFVGDYGKYHPYPYCAGHEGVGTVIEVGEEVHSVRIGQRVALHELPIGTPGGALMARHALRSERDLTPIPETDIPPHLWIVEPVVCVVNGLIHSGLQPGDRVALLGAGYMGLLFVQGLRRSLTANVTVFDFDDERLALAQGLGANRVVHLQAGEGFDDIAGSFDIVVDAGGTDATMDSAIRLVGMGGIIVNFAWHRHRHSFDLDEWHQNGWRILNIVPEMNPHFGALYRRAIALIANGTFSNEPLVTHVRSVEKASEVFNIAADKSDGYMKGVVTF